ncbi:DNA cytosine methyltransferase [Deinococcus sp. 23YEL01]|uniref:DNA cytosine methyltransferase n=1 Tax=Deinococcus sp. 23YEL01 TaxID=2745871 RepID=UPI001E2CBC5F|nr:DNA cytosine methyltransferase [Deinococcus sp. 23YEL01]MCD0168045.1 DNA cytosine methyltransferase [Deinococcus sp. 23YEL01]
MSIVSLFSGAMGLDIGLGQGISRQAAAGLGNLTELPELKVAVELDEAARSTITRNTSKDIHVFDNIQNISAQEIIEATGIKQGEYFLVSGGPPCQPFSTAGRRDSLNDPRGSLFMDYVRIVEGLKPRFFVMENVKGILSAAIKHRPISERGIGFPAISPEEMQGSAFQVILEELKSLNYSITYGLLNSADFGVPQKRERLIILGSRDGEGISLPQPTHGPTRLPLVTVRDAWLDLKDEKPEYPAYPQSRKKYLELVPMGGNWRSLPLELQEEAMGGAYKSGGGKVGFYRRLALDLPSPTVTTSPSQKATDMCHPTELRPISVREAARLQQFPDSWIFEGKMLDKYRQIGNAVPIGLGRAIGKSIMETVQGCNMPDRSKQQSQPSLF